MSKEYPQNSEEFWAYLKEGLAISGITVNPKKVSPSPNTPATGGTHYGVIMIPRTPRGLKTSTPSNSGTSPTNAKMNGRRNGRSLFRDGRDNTP